VKGYLWPLALSGALLGSVLAAGAVTGVVVGQPFIPSRVSGGALCSVTACRAEGPFTSEDKFTGANKSVLYRYALTWHGAVVKRPVVSVILNDHKLVRLVKLEFSVGYETAPAAFRDLVLAWGKTFELTPANLAPCLNAGDLQALKKYLSYADLAASQDGTCHATLLNSGQANLYFDIGLPEP